MEEEFQRFGYSLPYKRYKYCCECDNLFHQFSNYGDYIKYSLDRNENFIEQVNSDLEKFVRNLDNEHGTMLTPVGAKRIKKT